MRGFMKLKFSIKKISISLAILVGVFIFAFLNFQPVEATGFVETIEKKAVKILGVDDVKNLTDNIRDERLVLLGESTHGTSQYYSMRAAISKHLIKERGFNFVAVEGDWAAIYRLNLYVKGLSQEKSAGNIMRAFNRWPQWMWSNSETLEFVEWLRDYNSKRELSQMVGFYGIDVYGQWEAMDNLMEFVRLHLPEKLDAIKEKLQCFGAYRDNEWDYAKAVNSGKKSCENQLKEIVSILTANENKLLQIDKMKYFNALQSAKVLKNAESFFRLALQRGPQSWNARASHFYNTVKRLMDFYGENSRGVVWAHNTHIGDARATPMASAAMVNIGMLAREDMGEKNVYIIGFSTFSGKVLAGRNWASDMEKMTMPNAIQGSLEYKLNSLNKSAFFVHFENELFSPEHEIMQPIGHRAVGVVYNPQNEAGNYVPTVLPQRYDALVFFQHTDALNVLR